MLRKVVERLARGTTLKRRLPTRFDNTTLYVSPDAQLKYIKPGEGAFDKDLLQIVDDYIDKTSVVWDIGANVGIFTFAAASVAKKGHVVSIEADIWLAQMIRQSLQLKSNRNLNVVVVPCAVAHKVGVMNFNIAQRGRASNALEVSKGYSETGGIREVVSVPTLTLDTLLHDFAAPSFLKIDIEGAEALALEGAVKLLRDVRPKIYIEVGNETNFTVSKQLKEAGYLLYDGSKPLANQTSIDKCTFNTLAIPQ